MKSDCRNPRVLHRQGRELVYKVFSYFIDKQTLACQSAALPKRKNVLPKRVIQVLEVCKELFATAASQFVSLCAPPVFVHFGHLKTVEYDRLI
jgi:hypothetical protein